MDIGYGRNDEKFCRKKRSTQCYFGINAFELKLSMKPKQN